MAIVDRRRSVSGDTAIKAPCRAATTANITLAGEQPIDGVACVEGDRVLVKDQSLGAENGVYAASTGNWTRERDFDGAYDIVKGTLVRVTNGSTGIGYWEVTTSNPIVVGTTAIAFSITTNSISGVSAFVQTLLDDTTAAAFLATLGVVPEPIGAIRIYAGATAPSGYLLCQGQAVSRSTYSALFSVIGATFGAGDGTTTFNVPDMGGRVPAGKEVSATRLTTAASGVDGDALGATGGAQTVTLDATMIPPHPHPVVDPGHPHPIHTDTTQPGSGGGGNYLIAANTLGPGKLITAGATDSATTGITVGNNTGGGQAHNNVQPTIILNFIILTGVA